MLQYVPIRPNLYILTPNFGLAGRYHTIVCLQERLAEQNVHALPHMRHSVLEKLSMTAMLQGKRPVLQHNAR